MKPHKNAVFGYWTTTILALLTTTACIVAGCGGDNHSFYNQGPYTVQIRNFRVYGNDTPVNGREQIVSGINNGSFLMSLNLAPADSDDTRILISEREDLASTNLKQEIAHFKCGYYPFCGFDLSLNCNFSLVNQISCQLGARGSGNIQVALPQTDISPLLSGNQADLYVVLVAGANGAISSQRSVPVTFRHN